MDVPLAVVRLELDSDTGNYLSPTSKCGDGIMKIEIGDESVISPTKILMNEKGENCESSIDVASIKGVTNLIKEERSSTHQQNQTKIEIC